VAFFLLLALAGLYAQAGGEAINSIRNAVLGTVLITKKSWGSRPTSSPSTFLGHPTCPSQTRCFPKRFNPSALPVFGF